MNDDRRHNTSQRANSTKSSNSNRKTNAGDKSKNVKIKSQIAAVVAPLPINTLSYRTEVPKSEVNEVTASSTSNNSSSSWWGSSSTIERDSHEELSSSQPWRSQLGTMQINPSANEANSCSWSSASGGIVLERDDYLESIPSSVSVNSPRNNGATRDGPNNTSTRKARLQKARSPANGVMSSNDSTDGNLIDGALANRGQRNDIDDNDSARAVDYRNQRNRTRSLAPQYGNAGSRYTNANIAEETHGNNNSDVRRQPQNEKHDGKLNEARRRAGRRNRSVRQSEFEYEHEDLQYQYPDYFDFSQNSYVDYREHIGYEQERQAQQQYGLYVPTVEQVQVQGLGQGQSQLLPRSSQLLGMRLEPTNGLASAASVTTSSAADNLAASSLRLDNTYVNSSLSREAVPFVMSSVTCSTSSPSPYLDKSDEIHGIHTPECGICMETFTLTGIHQAKICPCGHTYCLHCLRTMQVKTCPACRNPYGNADLLPNNFQLMDLISSLAQQTSKPLKTAPAPVPAPAVVPERKLTLDELRAQLRERELEEEEEKLNILRTELGECLQRKEYSQNIIAGIDQRISDLASQRMHAVADMEAIEQRVIQITNILHPNLPSTTQSSADV